MRRFLFAPSMSYWQWLTMSAAFAMAFWVGTGWGLLAWLGTVIAGAVVEAVFEP